MKQKTTIPSIINPIRWLIILAIGLFMVPSAGCGSGEYERRMDKRMSELPAAKSSNRDNRDEADANDDF